jgi:tripartite-type tricarboxylate transporter receptor subunit TctC
LPPVAEFGLPQRVAENYFGASGPSGLPDEVTERLQKVLADIVSDPAIVERFEVLGITATKQGSAEFTAFVAKQVNDWQPAIKAADLE